MKRDDVPIDRDTLSGYLALILGFLTGVVSILSWVAAPFIWFVLCCCCCLFICRIADKWRYTSGILFNTAVVMGGMAILAILGARFSFKDLLIFPIAWVAGCLISTAIAHFYRGRY